MDCDPRDNCDARDTPDTRDKDERHPDDDDALSLGRGPSSARVEDHQDHRDRDQERHETRDGADTRDHDDARWPTDRDDTRWPDRDRPRDRGADPTHPGSEFIGVHSAAVPWMPLPTTERGTPNHPDP